MPREYRLPWQFGGVSLEGGDGWRAATSLASTAALSLQAVEGAEASRRAVLHLYATGRERALCLRSLLYGLAQICLGVLTLAVSVGCLQCCWGAAPGAGSPRRPRRGSSWR